MTFPRGQEIFASNLPAPLYVTRRPTCNGLLQQKVTARDLSFGLRVGINKNELVVGIEEEKLLPTPGMEKTQPPAPAGR